MAGRRAGPPPDAKVRVTDEQRRTIVRWIDLGCPIELDPLAAKPQAAGATDLRATYGFGWHCDDNRPTLALTIPADRNRLVVGAYDYYSGLDAASLTLTASFAINGVKPGENLAARLKPSAQNVWQLPLDGGLNPPKDGTLTVSI